MIDFAKKALFTGIGLAALSKEKIEEKAKELAKEIKLGEDEGRKFVDDVLAQSEEAKKNVEAEIDNIVKKSLSKLNIADKDEVAALNRKISELEKKLEEAGKDNKQ